MKAKELADLLNGREYRDEITSELEQIAKEEGLVVCFGVSDDLLELRGAISEEFEANDGGKFELCKTPKGTIFWDEDTDMPVQEFDCKLWTIKAIWCPEENGKIIASWLIKSDIPHEQFNIYEDDELYSTGIVFHIDEL